jgi:hypothetical protein
LDLYKLAVEMADRVSARRATANSFFFTMQTGLAVAVGAFAVNTGSSQDPSPDRFVLTLAAVAGVVIAGSWWLLLRSYRDLNTAKFQVINGIEAEHLPVKLFAEEWEYLKRDPVRSWRQRYAELGQVERVVPLIFALLYTVLAAYVAVG